MSSTAHGEVIPYARFLEVRARRLQIVTELTQPAPEGPVDVTAAAAPAEYVKKPAEAAGSSEAVTTRD